MVVFGTAVATRFTKLKSASDPTKPFRTVMLPSLRTSILAHESVARSAISGVARGATTGPGCGGETSVAGFGSSAGFGEGVTSTCFGSGLGSGFGSSLGFCISTGCGCGTGEGAGVTRRSSVLPLRRKITQTSVPTQLSSQRQ